MEPKKYLKQCEVVPADDVIQLGKEDDEERPAEEGQHAPEDLHPGLQTERAAAVARVSAALAKLDKLRSEKGFLYICWTFISALPDNYPAVEKEKCTSSWD